MYQRMTFALNIVSTVWEIFTYDPDKSRPSEVFRNLFGPNRNTLVAKTKQKDKNLKNKWKNERRLFEECDRAAAAAADSPTLPSRPEPGKKEKKHCGAEKMRSECPNQIRISNFLLHSTDPGDNPMNDVLACCNKLVNKSVLQHLLKLQVKFKTLILVFTSKCKVRSLTSISRLNWTSLVTTSEVKKTSTHKFVKARQFIGLWPGLSFSRQIQFRIQAQQIIGRLGYPCNMTP